MSAHLPLDILGMIVDTMSDNLPFLHQLALLNRDFVYPCRKHLFASISLSKSSCDRLYDVIEANPDVASYIRDLCIDGDEWAFLSSTLPSLLADIAQFESLRALMFTSSYTSSSELPADMKAPLRKLLQNPDLRFVRLGGLSQEDFPVSLLAGLPRLNYLGFFDDSLQPNAAANRDTSTSLLTHQLPEVEEITHFLRTLEVGNAASLDLINILMASENPTSLTGITHLVVHGSSPDLFDAVTKVLNLANDTIETFSWIRPSLPYASAQQIGDEPSPPGLDLSILYRVRVFRAFLLWGTIDIQKVYPALQACGVPPNIERFAVVVEPPYVFLCYFHPRLARQLDQCVMGILDGDYPCLTSIAMCIVLKNEQQAKQYNHVRAINLKKLFPLLHASGRFEVVFEESSMEDTITMFGRDERVA
ncbi:hypothetical protein DXG01_007818 [Tephrocybe rancida]|nr:hypothetical protein DXG01_007818 [Tephrocybe rancida]